MPKVVIVGSGIAGSGLAKAIKQEIAHCDISLITTEGHPPYMRPLLTQFFHEKENQNKIVRETWETYEKLEFKSFKTKK